MTVSALPALDTAAYQPHLLHGETRAWVETNCYVDVWIEVLNALGLEPAACMGMALANDFEGDQWTFYKPPHEDLYALYGLEIHELNVWRSLLDNALAQLSRGRLVLTEIDSFYLPDTAGTDYQRNHVKTTIAIVSIDLDAQRMHYFHNRSLHQVQGTDFVQLLRVGFPPDPGYMPFFAEFVRLDRLQRRAPAELASRSLTLLAKHFARRPAENPMRAYAPHFLADIEQLKGQGLPAYHAYAFANLRQWGSGAELLAYQLAWMADQGHAPLAAAAADFSAISDATKTLLLKAARAVSVSRPVELASMLDQQADHWDCAMRHLAPVLG